MADELVRRASHEIGEQALAHALSTLLSLTSDAVLVFNEAGTLVLVNDEAERVFGRSGSPLVGSNVRTLFAPARTYEQWQGPLDQALPFTLDGTAQPVIHTGIDHQAQTVTVRCERIDMPGSLYVLVGTAPCGEEAHNPPHLVDDLSRANRRLSGTLRIVLETLDALDVAALFDQVLDALMDTMESWAAVAYVSSHDGFRLRGSTAELETDSLPVHVGTDHPVVAEMQRHGGSLRLHLLPPSREDLRAGTLTLRDVRVEETGAVVRVRPEDLLPFAASALVPIWFGGHVIALVVLGWQQDVRLRDEDMRLLDSVAEYLSVQLAGAFAAAQAQHVEALAALGSSLRERMLAGADLSLAMVDEVFGSGADALEAACVPLRGNQHQKTTVAEFGVEEDDTAPLDLAGLIRGGDQASVVDIADMQGLASWLQVRGITSSGVLVVVGMLDGVAVGYILARNPQDEPFDEQERAFLAQLAQDVLEVEAGVQARAQDVRISKALQQGMRNELQEVEGISSQSCYTSATQAASVGGDFFDLIRLPDRRACVIMGDVSGKGIEAASVSSAVRTALGAYSWEGLKPARMVALLNDFLLGFSRVETFATMFVGIVDLGQGSLTYCSAGHPPALLVQADTGELVTLGVQSGVVGAFADMRYRDGSVSLQKGDMLLLYTDGVTEARSLEGAFFGEDGLHDAVLREARAGFAGMCDRLRDAVSAFTGGASDDDVALMVLRFDEVG